MIVRSLAVMTLFVLCATHADGQSYQYDQRGRLHLVTYSDCSSIQYDYDASGNRTERIVLAGAGDCAGNRRPIAVDDALTMAPGESKLFDLRLAHGGVDADSDPDESDPSVLRITAVTQGNVPAASGGAAAIVLQSDDQYVRVTAPNAAGTYQFTYTLSDPQGLTDQGQVQLTVMSNGGGDPGDDNTPPRFTSPSSISVTEGFQGVFYTASAIDDDGDKPKFLTLTEADAASFSFNASTGGLSLKSGTPPGAYNVTLSVTDNKSAAVELDLSVTVDVSTPQNQPPAPNTVSKTGLTRANEIWVAIPLTGIDADNDTVSLVGLTSVSNQSPDAVAQTALGSEGGRAEIHGSRDDVVRVWSSAPKGQWEEFRYWVSDGVNTAQSAVLRVRVDNRPPVPQSNRYTFIPGETRPLTDITANDTDPDGDDLTIGRVDNFGAGDGFIGGGSGEVNENDRTQVFYTAPSEVGSARFGAVIQDPTGGYAFQWVYIDVVAPQPVAHNDAYSVAVGRTTNLPVLQNDDDPAGGGLTIIAASGPWDDCEDNLGGGGNNGVEFPVEGICDDLPGVTISPDKKSLDFWSGFGPVGLETSLTYTVRDQNGVTSSAQVNLTLVAAANRAPNAVNDIYNVASGSTHYFSVLGNDSDPDGDTLSLTGVSGVSGGGSASKSGNQVRFTAPTQATTSSFTYSISDGRGGTDTATVTVDVSAPVNRAPNAVNDIYNVASGSTHYFSVLGNDSDPDGDTLSLTGVSGVSGGGSASKSGNQVRFTAPTQATTSSFTYSISDGRGGTDTATVTVDVSGPSNRAPTPVDDWPFVISGNARTINVLGNDTDPDGDTLYLASVSNGSAGGTASISGGQVVIVAGTARNETFTYTVRDRSSGGLQATATIHATVNRHPILQSETYTLSPGETRSLDVLSNDSDPDTPLGGQPLIIYAVTSIYGGASASPSSDGRSITYTAPTAAGTYRFTYWVKDQSGGVSNMVSYVTVAAPNQRPVTQPDNFTVRAGETRVLYGILSNDSDPDGDPLTIERVYEFQGGGSGSVNADRTSVTYTAPLASGSARFAYVAIDGRGGYRFNWVNITVLPPIDICGDGIPCQ